MLPQIFKKASIFDIAKVYFIILHISVDHAIVSWVLIYNIFKTLSILGNSFIPSSPPLCLRKGKDLPKMGYKRWAAKGGSCTKGEMGIFVYGKI